MSHDIGFSLEKLQRHAFLDRTVFRVGNEVRPAVKGTDQHVHKGSVLEPASPPCARNRIGNAGHMFGSSSKDDIGHPRLDHGQAGNHCFHAGGTDPVDGDCRNGVRYASHESGHTSHVQGICRLHTATIAHIIDHVRLNPSTFHRLFHGDTRNGAGVHSFKGSTKGSNCSTTRGNNNHILHN